MSSDLSSIEQTKSLAAEFLSRHDRLDVLLNNAGGAFDGYATTVDGIERTFALNHLSYYLLGNLLLDTLKRTAAETGEARIVNVSSSAHQQARNGLNLDAPPDPAAYRVFRVYSETKLANLYFTYELARRLDGTGVTVNAVHPGFVKTNLSSDARGILGTIFRFMQTLIGRSPERGAETLVYLAASPEAAGISGAYWADLEQKNSSAVSHDREQQRRLWEYSAEITGVG